MSTTLYNSIPDDFRTYVREPLDDSHLDGRNYSLRITNEMEHSRGIAWTGEIRCDGKIVAVVENAGDGGCHYYIVVDDRLWEQFADDAQIAYGDSGESKDSLVQFIDVVSYVYGSGLGMRARLSDAESL